MSFDAEVPRQQLATEIWLSWLAGESRKPDDWGSAPNSTRTLFAFCDTLFRGQLPADVDYDGISVSFTRHAFTTLAGNHDAAQDLDVSQADRVLYDRWGLHRRLASLYKTATEWPLKTSLVTRLSRFLVELTTTTFGVELDTTTEFSRVVVNGYDGRYCMAAITPTAVAHAMSTLKLGGKAIPLTALHALSEMQPEKRAAIIRFVARSHAAASAVKDTMPPPQPADRHRASRVANISVDATARALRSEPSRKFDLVTLQVVRGVVLLGLSPAPRYLVDLLVTAFGPRKGRTGHRVEEALSRLEDEGWIECDVSRTAPQDAAWRLLRDENDLGSLDLVPWLVGHHALIENSFDLRALLGGREALRRASTDAKLLRRLVNVTTRRGVHREKDPMLIEYAAALVECSQLKLATTVARRYRGDLGSAQHAWLAIAQQQLSQRNDNEFLNAIEMLDNESLKALVSDERDRLVDWGFWRDTESQEYCLNRLLRLVKKRPDTFPAIERLAKTMDRIYPYPNQNIVARLPDPGERR
jgi:hypothetical protein